MSDAEAVRLLADEYHLEFVDLDRYDVDQSTSSLLPGAVARRHRVVPIGRKFGAPIVAISNPGDVVAMDTLRAVIGREFIPVVADSSPGPDEYVVVSFNHPTNATMGGFWGLGFGVITPAVP